MCCQPVGQFVQGVVIACVRALTQLAGLTALSQPAGQPKLSDVLSGIGPRADHRDRLARPAPLSKPAGKLPLGMIVATIDPAAQLINLVVLRQAIRLPPLDGIARVCNWRISQRLTSLALVLPGHQAASTLATLIIGGAPASTEVTGEADDGAADDADADEGTAA